MYTETVKTIKRNNTIGKVSRVKVPAAKPAPVKPAPEVVKPKPKFPIVPEGTEDSLTAYFKKLAHHDLLTADDEKEISQGIEDTEILTWERVFSKPDVTLHFLPEIEKGIERPSGYTGPVTFPKLKKAAVELTRNKKDPKILKKYSREVKAAAKLMRFLDLDRVHIDMVIRELELARSAALVKHLKVSTWWRNGGTKDSNKYLSTICQASRDAENLRNEFIRANLRLVVTMARRYDRGGMALNDLIQEGNLGLMHAVARFDYRRGLRFSTYACWWIRHAIGRALADKARAVRIPVHMLEAQAMIEKVRMQLIAQLGRAPTPQELAKEAGVSMSKIDQTHIYLMGQAVSMEKPLHDNEDRTFGDTMADPDSEIPIESTLHLADLKEKVGDLMEHLSDIEADVIKRRFGLGSDEEETFREIGERYKLSRERIRQIQNVALEKLKRALEKTHRGHVEL